MVNPQHMDIINTDFKRNVAINEGGALYYDCQPTDTDWEAAADKKEEPCELLMTANLFDGNNATIGGAIRWTLVEPIITPEKD